jgi:hypothetical protein
MVNLFSLNGHHARADGTMHVHHALFPRSDPFLSCLSQRFTLDKFDNFNAEVPRDVFVMVAV